MPISTTYVPGGMQTETSGAGGGFSLPGFQTPDLSGVMQWRMQMEQQRAQDEAKLRAIQMQAAQQDMAARQSALARANTIQPSFTEGARSVGAGPQQDPWYTLQGAATKPIGGPGIVPGMMIDQTKLPPGMRPQSAQMVGPATHVPTGSIESPDIEEAARSSQTTNLSPRAGESRLQQAAAQKRNNSYYGR